MLQKMRIINCWVLNEIKSMKFLDTEKALVVTEMRSNSVAKSKLCTYLSNQIDE
jgi:hypothetical protein